MTNLEVSLLAMLAEAVAVVEPKRLDARAARLLLDGLKSKRAKEVATFIMFWGREPKESSARAEAKGYLDWARANIRNVRARKKGT